MDVTIPATLETLATGGSAVSSISTWWRQSKGDSRGLIGELKDNLIYLDMVGSNELSLGDVVDKLAVLEYRRLSKEGFNFNRLKKSKIESYPSLVGTDLQSWSGKKTEELVVSIYEKINETKIRFPHVGNNSKYRWGVRVNNIRKRIWLLLRHVGS